VQIFHYIPLRTGISLSMDKTAKVKGVPYFPLGIKETY